MEGTADEDTGKSCRDPEEGAAAMVNVSIDFYRDWQSLADLSTEARRKVRSGAAEMDGSPTKVSLMR